MQHFQAKSLGTVILFLVGLSSAANALWMLVGPEHWYGHVPAAIPDFGPYNVHFVRDAGIAYLTVSIGLLWSASREAVRLPMTILATMFFGGHALVHLFDTATGHVGKHHWMLDFPTTYLPMFLLIGVIWASRGRPVETSS